MIPAGKVASILLYGCNRWTLTKRIEKKLDGNCTRNVKGYNIQILEATSPETTAVGTLTLHL